MSIVEIPLSSGQAALVDEADAGLVAGLRWYEARRGRTSYAVAEAGTPGGRTHVYMHRLITGSAWPEVDHKNGNGLDNRRGNLRPANREGQTRNTGKKSRASNGTVPTSSFKGVGLHRASGLWRARLRVGGGRTISLGYFKDPEVAALAYDAAARRLHGEFAALNFPEPGERAAR